MGDLMKSVQKMVIAGFTAMMAAITLMVVGLFERTDFFLKRSFPLPQGALLLCGAGALMALCALLGAAERRERGRVPSPEGGRLRPALLECLFWLALFAFQAFVTYHAYFITDWDVAIILDSAYNMAAYGNPQYVQSSYYSLHSNNVLLTEVFALILRAFRRLAGDPGLDRCVLILCLVQCALNTCTGVLTRQIARRLSGSTAFSLAVTAAYVALVGCSPWSMIPYSDGVGLIFPVLTVYLYLVQEDRRRKLPYWIAMGALSAAAYLIKPQACIPAIAIVLIETARWLSARRIRPLVFGAGAMLLALMLGVGPIKRMGYERSMIEVDPERDIGMTHYLMLGLNRETSGTYSGEDFMRSAHVYDKEERVRMHLDTVKDRLTEMGLPGLLEHLKLKTLINYADGTFAWGINGVFFAKMIEDKDDLFSPLFKDVLYTSGSRYPAFAAALQAVWLALLAGSVFSGLRLAGESEEQRRLLAVLCLSIIGLSLFEWIFEAKARYLYVLSPVYVLLGVSGYWRLLARARDGWSGKRRLDRGSVDFKRAAWPAAMRRSAGHEERGK